MPLIPPRSEGVFFGFVIRTCGISACDQRSLTESLGKCHRQLLGLGGVGGKIEASKFKKKGFSVRLLPHLHFWALGKLTWQRKD